MAQYTLCKAERLNSKTMIARLFAGGNQSFPAYPLRVVYMWLDASEGGVPASMMVSVSKKRFKRAVKRNLIKRQVREAYRKNKSILLEALHEKDKHLVLAFIWLDNEVHSSEEVEKKVKKLLYHIVENME